MTRFIAMIALPFLLANSSFGETKNKKTETRQPSSSRTIVYKGKTITIDNSPVILKSLLPNRLGWFVENSVRGVYGNVTSQVVPVTREASAILQGLDVNKTHDCKLVDSTFVGKGDESFAGSYLVIDLECK